MSERTSEWPSTQRVDFMPFLPKSRSGILAVVVAVAMAAVHSGIKLYEIDAFIT